MTADDRHHAEAREMLAQVRHASKYRRSIAVAEEVAIATFAAALAAAEERGRREGAEAMRASVDRGCPRRDCEPWTARGLRCPDCPRDCGEDVDTVLAEVRRGG